MMMRWRTLVLLFVFGSLVSDPAFAESARHLNLAECVELALDRDRAIQQTAGHAR